MNAFLNDIEKVGTSVLLILCAFFLSFPQKARADEAVDYTVYDTLLKKYVSNGMVDYLKWQAQDFPIFESYIKRLETISLKGLSADGIKAFWINTYNALTIYEVLKHIPNNNILAEVFSVRSVPGFFDKITHIVAGATLTLDDIEKEKLREGFHDPHIHFVLVCASRSCPQMLNASFKEAGLDERLDSAAGNFIQDSTRNRLDQKNNVLYLSKIFKWYDSDFIASAGTVVDFVKKYMVKEVSEYLSTHKVKIKYLFYDWLINIKR